MHNITVCMTLCRGHMPAHSQATAIRRDSTPVRIERLLANSLMTLNEIADQLRLSLGTVRHQMPFTDAVPAGRLHNRTGRPRIRYALRGTPAAQASEPETVKHVTVQRVEHALRLQPMTIAELCRALSLSESSIRWAIPRSSAVAVGHRKARRKSGRSPVVYGLPPKVAP